MAEINDLSMTDANNTGALGIPSGAFPATVDDKVRAFQGALRRWLSDFGDGFVTTAGSSTAYTAASNRTLSAYYDGLSLMLEIHTAAGAAPTLDVDGVGAQSLVWYDGTAVSSNLSAGLVPVMYDLTNTNWVVLLPPPGLVASNNLSDLASAATARTNLGLEIGTDVQAYDADTLKADTADVLTVGFAGTPHNAGTQSSGTYTPDEANGNFQYAVNGGAHTLAPPTNNCTLVIQYTNNGSAGAITTSGFTIKTGDDFSTTNGDDFFAYITKNNGFSHLHVTALQ